jgi:hypothetical protein
MARETSSFRSQTRFSFFNGRYGSPAALPITAPFFFESETAGLMFVRHRWPQGFRWWLFCRFPREDAAADKECGHNRPENPKLHLLHCGVLRRPTPLQDIVNSPTNQVSRKSFGSLAIFTAIRRASSRLIWIKAGLTLPRQNYQYSCVRRPKMPHMCALITIAMQLTCVVDKEIICTDNEYLTQLLNVPTRVRGFSHQDRAGCFGHPTNNTC